MDLLRQYELYKINWWIEEDDIKKRKERRKYFHCMQCGSYVDQHPDYKCQALQNMLNNKQIQQLRGGHSFNYSLIWGQGEVFVFEIVIKGLLIMSRSGVCNKDGFNERTCFVKLVREGVMNSTIFCSSMCLMLLLCVRIHETNILSYDNKYLQRRYQ